MKTYDEMIMNLVERAVDRHEVPLRQLIEMEGLEEYTPGTLNVLTVDELNCVAVPFRYWMILAREYYDDPSGSNVAQYAVYEQHDADGRSLCDSMNANATYKLMFVCDDGFRSIGDAIYEAVHYIDNHMANDLELCDEIVRNTTDGDPLADLTYEDAQERMSAAIAMGYDIPPMLTTEFFLELYNDMKPEEE